MGQLMTLALRGVLVVLLAGAACLQGVLVWLLVAGSPTPTPRWRRCGRRCS